jgi:hypothetical protein
MRRGAGAIFIVAKPRVAGPRVASRIVLGTFPAWSSAMASRVLRASNEAVRPHRIGRGSPTMAAMRCRRKFLRYFKQGYRDATYVAWEREYKAAAARRFRELLGIAELRGLLRDGNYSEVARRAVGIEGRTNLLFSFEKMALRDALRRPSCARIFAKALLELVEAGGEIEAFASWCKALRNVARDEPRISTWPVATVFGFLAHPNVHVFLKPRVTRRAAALYDFPFVYASKPNLETYESLLDFADRVRKDTRDLHPRDMIDAQSFIWIMGSDEYP